MIQIEEVRDVPLDVIDDLTYSSKAEWIAAGGLGDLLVKSSETVLVARDGWDKPLIIIGFVRRSLCSPWDLWALVCQNLRRRRLLFRQLRPVWKLVKPGRVETRVAEDNFESQHMMRFFGLVPLRAHAGAIVYGDG